MVGKRLLCSMFASIAIVGCFGSTVVAAEKNENTTVEYTMDIGTPWASGSFNVSIPARSSMSANSSFPLEAGETVRINASYSPDASVDFGLVDANGTFYYFNTTTGSIDKTIQVDERGQYTLSIRNNSSETVSVSGYVRY